MTIEDSSFVVHSDDHFESHLLGMGCNTQISGGGSNLLKKAAHMERLLSQLIRVGH